MVLCLLRAGYTDVAGARSGDLRSSRSFAPCSLDVLAPFGTAQADGLTGIPMPLQAGPTGPGMVERSGGRSRCLPGRETQQVDVQAWWFSL